MHTSIKLAKDLLASAKTEPNAVRQKYLVQRAASLLREAGEKPPEEFLKDTGPVKDPSKEAATPVQNRVQKDLEDHLFTHPVTHNKVHFKSLPADAQKKIRQDLADKHDKAHVEHQKFQDFEHKHKDELAKGDKAKPSIKKRHDHVIDRMDSALDSLHEVKQKHKMEDKEASMSLIAEPRYRDYLRRFKPKPGGSSTPMKKEEWEAKVLGKPKKEDAKPKDEGGKDTESNAGVDLPKADHKAIADLLEPFNEPGPWGHVVTYAVAGKPMESKHVKKVLGDIQKYLDNWDSPTGDAQRGKWTAKDKKDLTKAKGILEKAVGGSSKDEPKPEPKAEDKKPSGKTIKVKHVSVGDYLDTLKHTPGMGDDIGEVGSALAEGKEIPHAKAKTVVKHLTKMLGNPAQHKLDKDDRKNIQKAKKVLNDALGVKSKPKAKEPEAPKKSYSKKYHPKVTEVMDKHSLTDDDAAEVKKFKGDKPASGKPVPPAELMRRFLAHAKPETKERMKGVSPAEFVKMLAAIMDDEGAEGGGKTANQPMGKTAMNKTAATVKLAKKLLHIAKSESDPGQRTVLVQKAAALLKRGGPVQAGVRKEAINPDTEHFIEWALNTQSPMDPHEVKSFVERHLNIDTQPALVKREGPRFQDGDQVIIKKDKHTDPATKGPYEQFNGKIGTVTSADGQDVLVAFKGEPAPVRFPGGMKPRGVGIYKYTPPFFVEGSAKIEMIYLADPTAKHSEDQKATVDIYLGRAGQHETRSANYYTGYVTSARAGQSGWYFQAMPQQRLEIDPMSEAGYQFRSFNPAKGTVMYIGLFGKRPTTWKKDIDAIKNEGEGDKDGKKANFK